jgi:hypothetical protein
MNYIQALKDYREFLQWDKDSQTDYENITQKQAKQVLMEDLEFIIGTNGTNELYQTEVDYCKQLGIEV